jgi:hypothetical protein
MNSHAVCETTAGDGWTRRRRAVETHKKCVRRRGARRVLGGGVVVIARTTSARRRRDGERVRARESERAIAPHTRARPRLRRGRGATADERDGDDSTTRRLDGRPRRRRRLERPDGTTAGGRAHRVASGEDGEVERVLDGGRDRLERLAVDRDAIDDVGALVGEEEAARLLVHLEVVEQAAVGYSSC